MATDVARLALQIDVTGAKRAKQALDGLKDGSIKATSATDKLSGIYSRLDKIIELTAKSQRSLSSSFREMSSRIDQNTSAIRAMASSTEAARLAIDSARDSAADLSPEILRQSQAAERGGASANSLGTQYQRLTLATDSQILASRRLTSSFVAQAASTRAAGQQTRAANNNFRNVALQLNQVAQQGAITGNFFQALAIQIPDLVTGLGPLGIILGGLAGGLATLAFSSQDAGESIEDLTDRTKDLVTELGRATDLQRQFINAQFQQSIQDQKAAIAEAEESIRSTNARLEDFRRAVGEDVPDAVFNSNSAVKSLRQELSDAELSIDNAESSIESITKQQEEFWREVEETGNKLDDTAEKLNNFVDGIVAQGETVGFTARQTALYEAARLGANEADIQAINNAFDLIEAEKAAQEQLKQLQKEQEALANLRAIADPAGAEFNRYADQIDQIEQFNITAQEKERLREAAFDQHQQRMSQIASEGAKATVGVSAEGMNQLLDQQQMLNQQIVGTFGNVLGAIRGFTEQGTAEWIAMTIAQKAIMAGQAIMAANLAAAQTLSASIVPGDPSSPLRAVALAETVRNLGYVNAGLIVAQGVGEVAQSFDGGGFTGNGPRSGGLDGKGGFLAMMHPQETVIDHTRGQGMGGGVVINIVNAPQGTRTETRQDSEGRQVIDIFIADMVNGGPMSKSIQGTFAGLRRQGR